MRTKLVALALTIALLVVVVWATADEDRRWLLLNRESAEAYAATLLRGDSGRRTPNEFVDYTVSSEGGAVLFAHHKPDGKIYGYFPRGVEAYRSAELDWRYLDDNWYVAELREVTEEQ